MTSISQERTKLAAVGMRLRRREEWGARFNYTNSRPVDEPATRVFVHISVTNPSSYGSRDAHARAIENIGINRFPATGISYNRLIFAGTDTVYEGQPIGRRGAHTVNDFKRSTCSTSGCPGRTASLTAPSWNLNYNARAYVICQNTQHAVTDQMVTAMARAIAADARAGFVTEYAALRPHGHRCVSSKSCPGNLMWAKMGSLKTKIAVFLSNPATIGGGSGGGVTIPDPTVPGGTLDPKDWFDMATLGELKQVVRDVLAEGGDATPYIDGKFQSRDTAIRRASVNSGNAVNAIKYQVLPQLAAIVASQVDYDALAAAIVGKLPNAGSASIDKETVKQGLIEVLTQGIGDAPT